jgi:membrane protease YdiL (CAAX protease family)
VSEADSSAIVAAPAQRGLGIARSIALCVVFLIITNAASMPLDWFKQSFALPIDVFSTMLVLQLIAWPITIKLGLQWAGASFREMCPLTPFPARIVPALLVISFGATILLLEVAGWIPAPEWYSQAMAEHFAGGSLSTLFLPVIVVAPVAEELFFRGLLLRGYLRRYSVTTAVWASAVLFAVFHGNPWQMVIALPLGVWFARMSLRTGSLLPGMLGHAMVNFSRNFLLDPFAFVLGYTAEDFEGAKHFPPLMLGLAGAMTVVGGLILWRQLANLPAPLIFSSSSTTDRTDAAVGDPAAPPASLPDAGEPPQGPISM